MNTNNYKVLINSAWYAVATLAALATEVLENERSRAGSRRRSTRGLACRSRGTSVDLSSTCLPRGPSLTSTFQTTFRYDNGLHCGQEINFFLTDLIHRQCDRCLNKFRTSAAQNRSVLPERSSFRGTQATTSRRCMQADKIRATRQTSSKVFAVQGSRTNQLLTSWDLQATPLLLCLHLAHTIIWQTSWSRRRASTVTNFYRLPPRLPPLLAASRNRYSSDLSLHFSQRNVLRYMTSCLPALRPKLDRLVALALRLAMDSRRL